MDSERKSEAAVQNASEALRANSQNQQTQQAIKGESNG
jgi:hypothetical protein